MVHQKRSEQVREARQWSGGSVLRYKSKSMLGRRSISLAPFYHEGFEMATSVVVQVILTRCFIQSEALLEDELAILVLVASGLLNFLLETLF